MNKSDLIELIATTHELTKRDSGYILNTMIEGISKSLKKGEAVQLTGFGTWDVKHREARNGRNPKTGEAVKIKAKTVPTFKAGKTLKDLVSKTKVAKTTKK